MSDFVTPPTSDGRTATTPSSSLIAARERIGFLLPLAGNLPGNFGQTVKDAKLALNEIDRLLELVAFHDQDAEAVAKQRDALYQRLHRVHAAVESDADLAGLAVRDFLARESSVAALPDVIVGLLPEGASDA